MGFPGGSVVKNLPSKQEMPAKQETWVQSLGLEEPLEKETAVNSSILAWGIPWTEKVGRLQSMRSKRVRHNLMTKQQQQIFNSTFRGRELDLLGVLSVPPSK